MEITIQKIKDYTVNNIALIVNPNTGSLQVHLIISGLDDVKLDIKSVDLVNWLKENKPMIDNEILQYLDNTL